MSEVRVEKSGLIATVTLSNPGKLNAISLSMWNALTREFTVLSQDEALRCVIVRGEGRNFAAGADIEEFPEVRSTVEKGMRYHTETIAQALQAISECLHPTIAAIEGVCVGGGLEIACACDLRIASPASRFGIPVNRLGFPLAPGELQQLLQLVGKTAALEILLEGRVFDASEAKDKRLINRIADDVEEDVRKTAQRIALGAPPDCAARSIDRAGAARGIRIPRIAGLPRRRASLSRQAQTRILRQIIQANKYRQ